MKATFRCCSFGDIEHWCKGYTEMAESAGLTVSTEVLEYKPEMFAGTLRKRQPDILVHVEGTRNAIDDMAATLDFGPVALA